jgi:hypothetical protein
MRMEMAEGASLTLLSEGASLTLLSSGSKCRKIKRTQARSRSYTQIELHPDRATPRSRSYTLWG